MADVVVATFDAHYSQSGSMTKGQLFEKTHPVVRAHPDWFTDDLLQYAVRTPADDFAGETVRDVLAWVGDDPEREHQALDVERRGKQRSTLIAELEERIAARQPTSIVGESGDEIPPADGDSIPTESPKEPAEGGSTETPDA